MVFGHNVVINAAAEYVFHRKVVHPRVAHTWTCPLATYTGATFLRREVVERLGLFFGPRWRYCGDAEWMLRVLQRKVRVGVLDQFTTVYALTGTNLSLTFFTADGRRWAQMSGGGDNAASQPKRRSVCSSGRRYQATVLLICVHLLSFRTWFAVPSLRPLRSLRLIPGYR